MSKCIIIDMGDNLKTHPERLIEKAEYEIKKILYPEKLTKEELDRLRLFSKYKYKKPFKSLLENQIATLKRFDRHKQLTDNCNVKTRACYLKYLKIFCQFTNKSLENITKEDILNFFSSLSNRSPKTRDNYKITIKNFYQLLNGMEGQNYPEIVSWLKLERNNHYKLPEELLTEEDIKKLVNVANNIRDKALIAVCYESACRVSELLGIRLKHVNFDEYGAILIVNGKTGMRRIRLINSVPILKTWLNEHPFKDDPEAPLWVDISKRTFGKPLFRDGFYARLKVLAKKAGLKKNVFPHLFRHSKMTEYAKDFTESELKVIAGWTRTSQMPAVYVSLSGGDIDKKILQKNGLLEKDKQKESLLKPKVCIRCNENNSFDLRFCKKCSYPLDAKALSDLEKIREIVNEFIATKLMQKPEFMKELPQMVEEWNKEKVK
jgi:integrase/ribosomal protein L40E